MTFIKGPCLLFKRNHYTRLRYWVDGPRQGQMRKDGKLFQEPYAYQKHYNENQDKFQGREAMIYRAVLPVCRYYIRLRYSLMQLLYDAMFENMITGLPIARAMVSCLPVSIEAICIHRY
jgi:hypothetical protein